MKRNIVILIIIFVVLSLVLVQGIITFSLYRYNYDCRQKLGRALKHNYFLEYRSTNSYPFIKYLYPCQFYGIHSSDKVPFTDEDLNNLYKEKLVVKNLCLNKSLVTLKGIESIKNWNYLIELSFDEKIFSKDEFNALKELKQLKYLDIMNSNLTEKDKAELKKALPNCFINIRNDEDKPQVKGEAQEK